MSSKKVVSKPVLDRSRPFAKVRSLYGEWMEQDGSKYYPDGRYMGEIKDDGDKPDPDK